ncbi:NACHT and WD repeat domain-containing protein [Nonomuraea rubra]
MSASPSESSSEEEVGVHLQAQAADHAVIHQAGRDQHIHYGDRLSTRHRLGAGTAIEICPYPGLAAFGVEQAQWFFGRDTLIAELLGKLDERQRTGGIQMVVAPSGAGKSSLLHAGLLSRLNDSALPGSAYWDKTIFTPGIDPLAALVEQLGSMLEEESCTPAEGSEDDLPQRAVRLCAALRTNGSQPALVVVDQFEEVFTQCGDAGRRDTFIDLLAELAGNGSEEEPPCLVVVGVRADFYAACAGNPRLRHALQDNPLVIGPMSETELRESIIFPAQDVGLELEPGLVEVLLHDLGTAPSQGEQSMSGYEPGRLPFLAHALRAAWQQRKGALLTVEGYKLTGTIQGAIAATADRIFTGLDEAGQRAAKAIFLRLVRVGDGTEDTGRRLSYSALIESSGTPRAAADVVEAYTKARLFTRRHETVEMTHEALLRGWPRIRRWLDDDRAGRLMLQDLEEAASAWEQRDRDSSLLYRGNHLALVRAKVEMLSDGDIVPTAQAFLTASLRQQRRATRARKARVAALAVLSMITTVAATLASLQQRETVRQRDLAVYNRVLAESDTLSTTDVSLSAQLALLAHRMRPSDATFSRLIKSENVGLSTMLPQKGKAATVAISPDGHTLVCAGDDGLLQLWDITNRSAARALGKPVGGLNSKVATVAFSPDGNTLATGEDEGIIRLWDVTDLSDPQARGKPLTGYPSGVDSPDGGVVSVAFSPDGRTLAAAGGNGAIRIWNVADPAAAEALDKPHAGREVQAQSVAFSPDGRTLVSAGWDNAVRLWNIADPTRMKPLGKPLLAHLSEVSMAAFSPDGRTLASAGVDRSVRLWDVRNLNAPRYLGHLGGHRSAITALAFSPDGLVLADVGRDGALNLWNLADPAVRAGLGEPLTGHTDAITSLAFASDGHTLATASLDGTVRLWNLPRSWLIGHDDDVYAATFTPDGHILATGGRDKTVRLWDFTDPAAPKSLGMPVRAHAGDVQAVAFSPDGHTLATAGKDRKVRLWNVTDPHHIRALGRPLTGHTASVWRVTFRPDGRVLASADTDGVVRLWDVADVTRPGKLGDITGDRPVALYSLAFSPDGRILVVPYRRGAVQLWNVEDPSRPSPVGGPLLGHNSPVTALAISTNGRTLATAASDRAIKLWNITDPARAVPLGDPLVGHGDTIWSLAFSSDGRTLASGSWDTSTLLWDVADPERASPKEPALRGQTDLIWSVAFRPDGHTLVSASGDGSVWVWSLRESVAIQRICSAAANALTAQKWQRFVGDDMPYEPPCPWRPVP